MKLDFKFNGRIKLEYASLFNQISLDIQHSYTELIDSVSKECSTNIDWWVSGPASRNTYTNPIYYYCCCYILLQTLIQKGVHISEVSTDSNAFKKIISTYLKQCNIRTRIRIRKENNIKRFFRSYYYILRVPLEQFILFISAKNSRTLQRVLPYQPITLIDTFVLSGSIEKDLFYPGLIEVASQREKESIYFVPLISGFKLWEYTSVIKKLFNSRKNLILKEHFLKIRDYLYAWTHIFRAQRLRLRFHFFNDTNFTLLIREQLKSTKEFSSSFIALLNYRFALRIKEKGIQLKLIINWFENQIIDRGFNAGFRKFYPETLIKGFQDFAAPPHYLCIYPTEVEMKSKVIPNRVAIISKGLVQSAKKFYPNLNVTVAPSLRFQNVWQKKIFMPDKDFYTILVTLPYTLNDSCKLLNLLAHLPEKLNNRLRIWIKLHPTSTPTKLKKIFGKDLLEEFEFIEGVFNDCIEKSNLLVSGASSACLETLAMGIPVVIIGSNSGFTLNPIPESIRNDMWQLCFSIDDLVSAINFFRNRSPEKIIEHEEHGKKIREEYFEPYTREGVRKFLELEPPK